MNYIFNDRVGMGNNGKSYSCFTLDNTGFVLFSEEKKRKIKSEQKWTDNGIGDEGASAISESLMINTTLTELWLSGDEIRNKE